MAEFDASKRSDDDDAFNQTEFDEVQQMITRK